MDILQYLLIPFIDIKLLFIVAAATLAGIFVGAIPGLSVTMGVALLLSFTFTWDVLPALAAMVGVYWGGIFGGSRASILLNMPGAPSNVATTFDGYPLSQRGETGLALNLTTIASGFGGFLGVIVMATMAPIIGKFAIKFAPLDYFLIAMLGLLLIGSLSKGSMAKGIFVAGIGVMIGFIGMDPITGATRFTFGSLDLMSGVNFIAAILGLFGFSEVLYQLKKLKDKGHVVDLKSTRGMLVSSLAVFLKHIPLSIRVSIIGVFIGALPGVGADVAALLGYDHAKQTTKNPSRPFGEGAYEGVVSPEAANNAAVPGTFIPMLTLGIPGDSVTAIFLGALMIQGLQPGPLLMVNNPHLFWVIVTVALLANIFMLIFGLMIVRFFIKVVQVPKSILLPIISLISVVGAFAINNSLFDINWMFLFAAIALILKIANFPVAPMVIGIILGPIAEINFRRAYVVADSSLLELGKHMFTAPISAILSIAFIYMLLRQTPVYTKLMEKRSRKSA